jgi:2-octaprenyl-6-methoxyphenol hydroxylase
MQMPEITIIGAGPVGATFALLAKRQGLNVCLMEAREGPSRETRSLALSHGSRDILDAANAWNAELNATEIHAVHTSQKGGFGRSLITREDGNVPALGYVLSYADLQTALDTALEAQRIVVQRGAAVSAFEECGDHVDIRFTQTGGEHVCQATVVVLADGGANLGKVPAISVAEKDYGQAALLGHIETDAPHRGTAYERFTPEGPAALLPHGGVSEYSMVWVSSPSRIEELKALEDAAFLAAFQQHFGHRAGRFTQVAGRRSYPLRLRTVSSRVAGNIAVIGNAAQALHPVAGQGFNLGLRDANDLARLLADAQREQIGKSAFSDALKKYGAARNTDVERSVAFTDFLVSAFSNDHLATRVPRGLALAAVDMLPFARRALARRMLFGALK